MDLKDYSNLMIVAHPDDEIIWGSKELINKNYLVVCVTCGSNPQRAEEFKKVMKYTDDKYLMLYYPDKVFYRKSHWLISYKYIRRDLKIIENYKNWDMILTHNKKGEYGHIHHKMVHKMVMATTTTNNIYVFGKYCSKKKMIAGNCHFNYQLSPSELNEKEYILKKYYPSQKKVVKHLFHILPYENTVRVSK
jgi:LmbE family N-acetylglucosaminyl deacetylase